MPWRQQSAAIIGRGCVTPLRGTIGRNLRWARCPAPQTPCPSRLCSPVYWARVNCSCCYNYFARFLSFLSSSLSMLSLPLLSPGSPLLTTTNFDDNLTGCKSRGNTTEGPELHLRFDATSFPDATIVTAYHHTPIADDASTMLRSREISADFVEQGQRQLRSVL